MDIRCDDATRVTGTLRLSVQYVGETTDETGGTRRQFRYHVESTDVDRPGCHSGDDLYTGGQSEADPDEMIRTLALFLLAAAEAYQHRTEHADQEENVVLFPPWLEDAAILNADELSLLVDEARHLDAAAEDRADFT